METLVLSQHRNQYYNKSRTDIPDRFGSSTSRGFSDINCRSFHSGAGILPSPFLIPSRTSVSSPSPTSLEYASPSNNNDKQFLKVSSKSSAIPIVSKPCGRENYCKDELSYSELWAGPTYSNSPPPSSLPMPKFSLRQKRSISLDLPSPNSDIMIHPMAKSAPASPTRESYSSASDFFSSTASATENLRRILHLDLTDD